MHYMLLDLLQVQNWNRLDNYLLQKKNQSWLAHMEEKQKTEIMEVPPSKTRARSWGREGRRKLWSTGRNTAEGQGQYRFVDIELGMDFDLIG